MNENVKSLALELWKSGMVNKNEIAREICNKLGISNFDKVRLAASRHINKYASMSNDNSDGDKKWDIKSDSATFEYSGRKSITTLDEAILFCEADMNIWDIDRYTFNSWDVTTKEGLTHTNYQVKVFFVKKNYNNKFNYNDFKDDLIDAISKWSPNYPRLNREQYNDPHCMVFSPADIHIGKLCSAFETGEEYNSQIAVQRVLDGMHGIIKKSQGFDIEKVIFIAGNDILHVDTPRRTTTSGTPQDTDGMWYDNFIIAKKLLVDIIETLMSIADVEVYYNPSNHDYMSGFMLFDSVSAWFRNSKQVEFFGDISHRKYACYGKNLIGMTHMDGAKPQDLPLLMAHEASMHWAFCPHRYIYGHHVHHKTSKDYMSVCVETLRSPSGTDSWHHRNGYQFAPAAVEAFIHHKDNGQVARLTHLF